MNRAPEDKKPFSASELLTNSTVVVTTIFLVMLAYCISRAIATGWEHATVTMFCLDREQARQLGLFCMDVGYCIWLTNIVSKIEKSGVAWSDGSNSDVKDARKCILYIVFISGLLLLCSKASLVSLIGLAFVVLVLGLEAGFFFYKFRIEQRIHFWILTLTSLMFIVAITWAFCSR